MSATAKGAGPLCAEAAAEAASVLAEDSATEVHRVRLVQRSL